MAKHLYAEYSIEDFDKFDCLKMSKGVYILLIFVLRGYLVWLMSVVNMKDRVATLELLYPDTSLFYLSLFSGVLGLFVVLLLSLRRPDAANWVKVCWRHCRAILFTALLFDLGINFIGYFYFQLVPINFLVIQVIIVSGFMIYCYKSHRFSINLREFPDKLPE